MMPSAARTAYAQSTNPMIRPSFSIRMCRQLPALLGLAGAMILLFLVPSGALGQSADVKALIERGQRAGLDADQMQTVIERADEGGLSANATVDLLQPAVELAERDLPAAPLLNKTLEGMAKQVPSSRMEPVLQRVKTYTEQAEQTVNQWTQRSAVREMTGEGGSASSNGEARMHLITAATEAQQQDIPLETLKQFLNDLPSATKRRPVSLSEVAAAMSVHPDLPGSRRAPEATQELLTAALDAGYDAESLRQLPAALESAHRESQQPVDALTRGAAQAIAQGAPATNVLQNLFQGAVPGSGPPGDVGKGPPDHVPGSGKPPGEGGPPSNTGPPEDPPGGGGPPSGGGGGG